MVVQRHLKLTGHTKLGQTYEMRILQVQLLSGLIINNINNNKKHQLNGHLKQGCTNTNRKEGNLCPTFLAITLKQHDVMDWQLLLFPSLGTGLFFARLFFQHAFHGF